MKIEVGNKVQYSRNFLRSTGMMTGKIPFAKGVVTEIKNYGGMVLASIDWHDAEIPGKVNVKNLNIIGRGEVE